MSLSLHRYMLHQIFVIIVSRTPAKLMVTIRGGHHYTCCTDTHDQLSDPIQLYILKNVGVHPCNRVNKSIISGLSQAIEVDFSQ